VNTALELPDFLNPNASFKSLWIRVGKFDLAP
jgi:hypothetical protein